MEEISQLWGTLCALSEDLDWIVSICMVVKCLFWLYAHGAHTYTQAQTYTCKLKWVSAFKNLLYDLKEHNIKISKNKSYHSLHFCCHDKTLTKFDLWEERGYLAHITVSCTTIKEIRKGSERRNVETGTEAVTTEEHWLAPRLTTWLFLTHPRPT